MRPLDRVIYNGTAAQVGSFTCATNDPRFRDSGPTENYLVVFPRNGVWIRHAGSRPFVADPQLTTIYNRGQEYTRESLSPDGDRCDWFAVSPDVAADIGSAFDPRSAENPERPFQHQFGACASDLYLHQRTLFLRLARGAVDPLEADEAIIGIVAEVIARAQGGERRPNESRRVEEARRDLVERARAEIVAHVAECVTVATLAERLDTSPFHLCRVFRSHTGLTLHAYRLELRQRILLERLAEPGTDLSRIAIELGFSSHSHLSATLRRRARITPSALRRVLSAAGEPHGLVRLR